jgi:tRNA1(Val) A37 N6-methylase TrmN6
MIVEAARGGQGGLEVMPPLILYREGNVYTEELEEIYRML